MLELLIRRTIIKEVNNYGVKTLLEKECMVLRVDHIERPNLLSEFGA